jgi:A/G-specific adenine glycosylase
VRAECRGYAEGIAETLPLREEGRERPVRRGVTFVALREDGAVLLRERPLRGLLGGMLETPSSPWAEDKGSEGAGTKHAPLKAEWKKLSGLIEHTFTHFHLELSVYRAEVGIGAEPKRAAHPERCRWLSPRELVGAALPSVMRKVLAHALSEDELRPARRGA